ncbi:MAG: C25 family cysteine peptidase [Candidatus Thiodiazotropha sp.]
MVRRRLCMALGLGVSVLVSGGVQAARLDLSSEVALTQVDTTNVANTRVAVEERKWVALDQGQEPGSEAEVKLNSKASSKLRSVFDITIPGFWVTSKRGDDGRVYQQIEIPGLGSHNELGKPDLPSYKFRLALPFSKGKVSMHAEVQELRRFEDVLVWPQPVPELDGVKESGTPEQFVIDRETYASKGSWPGALSPEGYEIGKALRGIPAIQGEAWPVQWDPASGELQVASKVTYILEHLGEEEEFDPITQERSKLAEKTFINWEIIQPDFGPNYKFYTADYLFIYPDSSYADEIKPLVDQKKARGFKVTEMNVADDIGASTCTAIRSAIQAWEASVPFSHDAYALLVGDTDVIPHCTSPDGDQTDDLYASTDGDDLEEEIYLGRLSVDSETDLANQVDKILTYEDHPSPFCCYNRAGLWAHEENAPLKYEGAHETVRTFAYTNPPVFQTFYGSQVGVTDSDVVNRVNNGVGLMAYRGHGDFDATATSWNQDGEYFDNLDVATLANPLARSPVVWSFACTNSKLDVDDSIAEQWMELAGTGAVSYYGATRTSYTIPNHTLDEWMFRAVYDEGLLTQSHAIERGEAQMADLKDPQNAWMYLLLGDPDMKIRTKNPYTIKIEIPELIEICKLCELPIRVMDEHGKPLSNALVGLWKPAERSLPNMQGETWINGYTDEKGSITLPYTALSEGELYYSVEDGAGNAVFEKVQVVK